MVILGVLTKPNRIPTGEEARWLPFIGNKKKKLFKTTGIA